MDDSKYKVLRCGEAWTPMLLKGDTDELPYQFEYRFNLGVTQIDPKTLLIFGGTRKMQQMETWCMVEINSEID